MKSYLNTSLSAQKRERHELVKHYWVTGVSIALCCFAVLLASTTI